MELTKEQIQFIDHRLENEDVKYWDIRIEMLDHIVSDVETQLNPENTAYEFKEIVQKSFEKLGWKENFNGSGFEKVLNEIYKNTIKNNRRNRNDEFSFFFKNSRSVLILILTIFFYYLISEVLQHKQFIIFSYILFSVPLALYFYESVRLWRKKIGKSFQKEQHLFLIVSSYFLFNIVMLSMKSEGQDFALPLAYQKPILLFVLPVHLLFSFIGYKTYQKAIVKVQNMRKQLLS